jgi:hypothetical protein
MGVAAPRSWPFSERTPLSSHETIASSTSSEVNTDLLIFALNRRFGAVDVGWLSLSDWLISMPL